MYLKRLDIYGFKSFAERTELIFPPGITGVVGPNGSGKSNISDAILWVLGEQNVRQLRGAKSDDVIFAGTAKRRPLGMAEVSLTLDNTTGVLPVDFTEVTVTRRAYRSGEGEYFINRTPCRLKDIYELFLDTGVGREAYSIINQSEIDALLSVRPEDRRQLFEEAAGIKKYRHRKKEASRKLDVTQANLLRVNDILSEIEGQIEPLSQQAEVATRYRDLTSRLRLGELRMLANDYSRLNQNRGKLAEEIRTLHQTLEEIDTREQSLTLEEQGLRLKLTETESRLDQLRHRHEEAAGEVQRLHGQIALARQDKEAALKSIAQIEKDLLEVSQRISRNTNQTQQAKEREKQYQEGAEEQKAKLQDHRESLEKILKQLADASAVAETRKSDYIELARKLAIRRNELANKQSELKSLQKRLEKTEYEAKSAEQELTAASQKLSQTEKQVQDTRSQIESLTKEKEKLASLHEENSSRLASLKKEIDELQRLYNTRSSRMHALQEMQSAFEGFYQGVRSTMLAANAGELHGDFNVVAEVVQVPKELETAVEVALGGSLQDIIAENEEQVKQAIAYLKRTQGGRATFLPLNRMHPTGRNRDLQDSARIPGVLGIASELIQFKEHFRPAIETLLGKVIVAGDLDAALSASEQINGWSRIVTPQGELLAPNGAITGGSHSGKGAGLLARKRELDELKEETLKLSQKLKQLEDEAQRTGEELARILSQESENSKKTNESRMAFAKFEKDLEHLKKDVERITKLTQEAQSEQKRLSDSLAVGIDTENNLAKEIETLSAENASLDQWMSENQQEITHLSKERDRIASLITQVQISLASQQEKVSASQREQRQLQTALQELEQSTRELNQKKEDQAKTQKAAEKKLETLENSHQDASVGVTGLDSEINKLKDNRTHILDEIAENSEKNKSLSDERTQDKERIHNLEIKDTQTATEISNIEDRLRDDYELTPEDAAREALDESVRNITYAEVARLRREVRAMGDVNVGAIDEYKRVSERYEFLTKQREDLSTARTSLLEVIKEIDESTKVTFMETFHAIEAAFEETFERLFSGGKTQLVLTNPSDLLETGIEVNVQPPGKKLQNLHLLSGGERALTAMALLFALLKVKPSPFCVMDEVDAPLDEYNVGRFGDILGDYCRKSQFIVVTHNKRTMETADVLYGVTMQEPGVSKVMSVQLSEVDGRS